MSKILDTPSSVIIYGDDNRIVSGPELNLAETKSGGLAVSIASARERVRFIRLRWEMTLPPDAIYLGDAWERTYGDLQWRTGDPFRGMPWYFLMKSGDRVSCFGVQVRPAAFALWYADPQGITLYLDVRCGTAGVDLRGRTLEAATIHSAEYSGISSFEAATRFCGLLCPDPLLPAAPVYGGNNWYYAYGNSSHAEIIDDAGRIAALAEGLPNRPYMVIDDGWEVNYDGETGRNSGPWDSGNSRFPDMPGLASRIADLGVKPGIWFRPLWNDSPAVKPAWRLQRGEGRFLDPSRPEVLELVGNDTARLADWGYQLIKHDFSTFDLFGRWGFQIRYFPAEGNWSFADTGKTSAEIVTGFYRTILNASGNAVIIGCNTIGHLGAGLMHLSRTGDDTSGKKWERTCKMGVNTLAFRLCQHKRFFDLDADCLGVTETIPWSLNRQWGKLLAESGTGFFASIKPGVLTGEEEEELKRFFAIASRAELRAEPLDWERQSCPQSWAINGRRIDFSWFKPLTANPECLS